MPRLAKTDKEVRRDNIKIAITSAKIRCGISDKELAGRTGIALKTLYRRYNNPDEFRLSELLSIANILNISVMSLTGVRQ